MKVKDLIKVLSKIENQDAEVLMYNGDQENSFQNIDFVNVSILDYATEQIETITLNDQYNSKRFTKEGIIIPLTDIVLTENNITDSNTKVLKLQNLNPLELGFLEQGDELEIRFINNSICVVNKSNDNKYFESRYAYCIFNQDSLDFITSFKEGIKI